MSAERNIEELYPRAPRYVVELGDNEIVRFAHMPRGSKAMHTRIINLSESGMAFLVPYLTAPQEGEKIKVEFSAPNSESIACFAKVARVQIHRTYHNGQKPQTFKMVAVEFQNLPAQQRKMIADSLNHQFKKKHAEYKRQQIWLKAQWLFNSLFIGLSALFSRIFPNKDKKSIVKSEQESDSSYIDV